MENGEDIRPVFLILQGENQYGVLDLMMQEFQRELETSFAYRVKRIDLMLPDGEEEMYQTLSTGVQVVFCLQGIHFDLRLSDGRYLMQVLSEDYRVKVFGWIVDSWFHHYFRLCCMNEKMKVALVDDNEKQQVIREYGVSAYTVHHFGIGATGENLPICQRKIDLFLPCTCKTLAQQEKEMVSMVPDPFDQSLIREMALMMMRDDRLLNWEALEQVCRRHNIPVHDPELSEVLKIVEEWADSYYRTKQREKCILALIDSGMKITVCGTGWTEFAECYDLTDRLHILGDQMDYRQVLDMMDHSKMVLNICPSYKEAAHERICTAMLRGAVCLTDSSAYLEKHFIDGENILYFSWDCLEDSFGRVREYLNREDALQQIADCAYDIAAREMTVSHFANQVIEIVEKG